MTSGEAAGMNLAAGEVPTSNGGDAGQFDDRDVRHANGHGKERDGGRDKDRERERDRKSVV